MRLPFVILGLLLLSACASAPLPRDVDDFVARRDICDHLRGEIPDNGETEQMQETISKINHYCSGTDAELAGLKRRYSDSPRVLEKLNGYEQNIERKR